MHPQSEYERYLAHRRTCMQAIWNNGFGSVVERVHRANEHHRDLYVECGLSMKFSFTEDDWMRYFKELRRTDS